MKLRRILNEDERRALSLYNIERGRRYVSANRLDVPGIAFFSVVLGVYSHWLIGVACAMALFLLRLGGYELRHGRPDVPDVLKGVIRHE